MLNWNWSVELILFHSHEAEVQRGRRANECRQDGSAPPVFLDPPMLWMFIYTHFPCICMYLPIYSLQYTHRLDGYILYIADCSICCCRSLGDVDSLLHPFFMWLMNTIHFSFIHRFGSASACVLSVMMPKLYI